MKFHYTLFHAIRESQCLTLEEVARKIGVSQQCVHNWDSGRNAPRPQQVYKLAKALNCSVYDISDLAPLPDDPALQETPANADCEAFRQGIIAALINSPLDGDALKIALQIVQNYGVK